VKITRLETFVVDAGWRAWTFVKVETDEGITGWGECYNHGPDRALPPLLDYLFAQIAGHDPTRIEFLILKLLQQARFPPGALGLAAIAAIDHCLWDISAKALGVPVYKLLGGNARERVQVYAGVYTAPDPAAKRRAQVEIGTGDEGHCARTVRQSSRHDAAPPPVASHPRRHSERSHPQR
jgi:galactonate dehydratase